MEELIKIYELGKSTDTIEDKLKSNAEEENELFSQWNYLKEIKGFQN